MTEITLRTNSPDFLPRPNAIPGNPAIWAAILAEMSEFAIMFIVYFLAKAHHPDLFNAGPLRLNTLYGTLNTLVMLSSSYFVVKGVIAIRANQLLACRRWLWMAVFCGCTYLLIKFIEYQWNAEQGIHVKTDLFYGVYYYVTFNHFLHVGWGTASIVWVITRLKAGAYDAENHDGLITMAVYWHMIDLAWITIFPLLYVMR